MINKIFPRILNPSADARVRKPTEMTDALNVSVGTDFDSGSEGDNSGDVGVLKPARGNEEVLIGGQFTDPFVQGVIPDSDGVIANQRVIGSVTDEVMGVIFFFVWSNVPNEMGVYAYDRDGVLPYTQPNSYTKVFNTSEFNFQSTSFVKGDVVHFGRPHLGYDKTVILYFTDNINEPRKLDVFRAMTLEQGIQEYDLDDMRDFITACPKTPLAPITFKFSVDPSRSVSNFTKVPGMQFAYQHIYRDGSESAISTYSLLAIPNTYTFSGTEIPAIIPENVCILTIPRLQGGDQINRTKDIEAVRVLVRFGEAGVLKAIDEVDVEDLAADIEYNFFNDRVLVPIPQKEQNKLFTNLPRRAQAQAIASDRLIYANYLDGYDNVLAEAEIEADYKELPNNTLDVDIKLHEFICQPTSHNEEEQYGRNRVAGYIIEPIGVPDLITTGSTFNINIIVSPAENFHVYDHAKSFHATPQTAMTDNYNEEDDINSNYFISNDVPEYTEGRSYFGDNQGVSYNFNDSTLQWNHGDGSVSAQFGTSAANPLILKGPSSLQYELQFEYTGEGEPNGTSYVAGIVAKMLSGDILPDDINVVIQDNVDTYEIDCNLNGNEANLDIGVDYRKDLIVGVRDGSQGSGIDLINQSPCGYFIVNKANVSVGFKNFSGQAIHMEGVDGISSTDAIVGLDIKEISDVDARTCVPYFRRKGFMGVTPSQTYIDLDLAGNAVSSPNSTLAWNFKGVDVDINDPPNYGSSYGATSDGVPIGWGAYVNTANASNAIFENLSIYQWRTFSREYIATTDVNSWRITTTIPGSSEVPTQPLQTILDNVTVDNVANDGEFNSITDLKAYENVLWYPSAAVPTTHVFTYIADQSSPWNSPEGYNGNTYLRITDFTSTGVHQTGESRGKIAGYLQPAGGNYNTPIKLMEYSSDREDNGVPTAYSSFSLLDGEGVFNSYDAYKRGDDEGSANYKNGSINGNVVWNGHLKNYSCHRVFNYTIDSLGLDASGNVYSDGMLQEGYRWGYSGGFTSNGNGSAVENFNNHLYDDDGNGCPERRIIQPALLKYFNSPQETQNVAGGGNIAALSGVGAYATVSDINTLQSELDAIYAQSYSNAHEFNYAGGDADEGGILYYGDTLPAYELSYFPTDETYVDIMNSFSTAFIGDATTEFRSFKTKANHEFGIVYYDERGRSGNVNYLGGLYVGGYNNEERGANKGRVEVGINLKHNPPEWAKNYQIVYAGNSSVEDFIQYSTGSAFIDTQNETPSTFTEQDNLIYVSLNHLQGDNNISYTSGFGAVNKDGGKDMYVYSVGDKLSVISYVNNDGSTRVYPKNYTFDVVGVKTFNAVDNPFVNSDATAGLGNDDDTAESDTAAHPSKVGQFIVLRDNMDADGFSYADILASYQEGQDNETGVNGETVLHFWNNRTIVEIYSPKKSADADDRIYFEIGECYNVIEEEGELLHAQNPVVVRRGDVFWRRVPVNLPEFNDGGFFESIMKAEGQTTQFQNFYLETQTFSDLFPFTDVNDFAKPKIIIQDAGGLHRRASLTYSDKNNYNGKFNKFASFNDSVLNFKDIPNEYGAINFIMNNYDSVLVIQENKTSILPVARNIISSAAGVESLTTSNDVLGTQKFYAGDYGCDNNPESVVKAGTNVYFANKSAREVYRFNPSQGISVISEQGMKKFFRNLFRDAMTNAQEEDGVVRVVGGYDPLNDEFIISVNVLQDVPNLDQEPDIPEGVVETIDDLVDTIVEQEDVIEDQSDTIDGLEDEVDDLEDIIEQLEDEIGSASNGDGTFSITAEKYRSILKIVGPKMEEVAGQSNFYNTAVQLDMDANNQVDVPDLLAFFTVHGLSPTTTEPEFPIIKVSDDPDVIAESDTPDEAIAIVSITEE